MGKVELFNGDLPSPDAMHDKFAIQHVEHHGTHDSDIDTASVDPPSPVSYLVNPLSRFRHQYKEYLGEFIGTMVLIIFGNGVNCQVVLSNLTQGSYLSISFGWGIGVMWVASSLRWSCLTLTTQVWRLRLRWCLWCTHQPCRHHHSGPV